MNKKEKEKPNYFPKYSLTSGLVKYQSITMPIIVPTGMSKRSSREKQKVGFLEVA